MTAIERTDWHVLVDSLEAGNASAVLTVARSLQSAAAERDVPSFLVVGSDQAAGRRDREGLLRGEPDRVLPRLVDTATKSTIGRPLTRGRTDFSSAASVPTHIYLHNQPWLAAEFRRRYSDAAIYLYAHNRLLRRVPRPAVRRLVAGLDGVICVSRFLADDLADRCGLDPTRLHVVHSGVDAAAFAAMAPVDTDIAFVGRMVEEKGVHVLIDALVRLSRRGLRVSARLAGSASFYGSHNVRRYERRLRARADSHGLDVQFDGYLQPCHVPRYLNSARIVAVPSVWPEPLGLVALEAMASHAALVCSRAGGMPEVVDDAALLVEPGDADDLAAAIEELIQDEPRRRRLADLGRRRAAERTWARAFEQLRLVRTEKECAA